MDSLCKNFLNTMILLFHTITIEFLVAVITKKVWVRLLNIYVSDFKYVYEADLLLLRLLNRANSAPYSILNNCLYIYLCNYFPLPAPRAIRA